MRDAYKIKCNCKFLIINDLKPRTFALNQWLFFYYYKMYLLRRSNSCVAKRSA